MIYILSINPTVDIIVTTESIHRDRINMTRLDSVAIGGKGFNCSRALSCLESKNTVIAFWGGVFSSDMEGMLKQENIDSELIPIQGSIRINIKVVEEESGKLVELNERGPLISRQEMKSMLSFLKETGRSGDYFILSGSLPHRMGASIYGEIIGILRDKDVNILLDTSGDPLFYGIKAIPDIIKINQQEISEICDNHFRKSKDTVIKEMISSGIKMVMVTNGPYDTFYYDIGGKYRIKSPDIEGPYKTGAGDSVNAGLIHALSEGLDIEEMLRLAVACGNANILSEVPGKIDRDTVMELASKIIVTKEQ